MYSYSTSLYVPAVYEVVVVFQQKWFTQRFCMLLCNVLQFVLRCGTSLTPKFVLVKTTQNILIVHATVVHICMVATFDAVNTLVLTFGVHYNDHSNDRSDCCKDRCNWFDFDFNWFHWFKDSFNTQCFRITCKDVNTKRKNPVQMACWQLFACTFEWDF